jgi:signal transduction histidine kinase
MSWSVTFLLVIDWLMIAVSFFNTIAAFWLGLTVLLNAERRNWGTWAAGSGLLFGAAFFAIHTTLISPAIWDINDELQFWWPLLLLPFLAAPYIWYLMMAWFSGVLQAGWHRITALSIGVMGLFSGFLIWFGNALPTYGQVVSRQPSQLFTIAGIPVVLLVYPAYSVLCVLLSLAALRQPVAAERFMGDLGRQRARPWLIAATLMMLLVCLATGTALAWLLERIRLGDIPGITMRSLAVLIGVDLLISGMIAIVIVFLGRAIVSYEVFTGKTLPRGGLARYWRQSLILAAGYGLVVGATFNFPLDPVYQIMLATLLMTVFFALMSWRAFVERERSTERLRPFVASQRLYDRLLQPLAPQDVDIEQPFRALCDDLLNTKLAYLQPLGTLAPLTGGTLVYRSTHDTPVTQGDIQPEALNELSNHLRSPDVLFLPIKPKHYNGAVWAVPLWSERGLAGALLLGEKQDRGLYTQEEIEIARAVGERLIDTQAAAELSRRLMTLQRRRLAESQVLDRRARRVLHDDVLPRLHTVMLMLAATKQPVLATGGSRQLAEETERPATDTINLLTEVHQQIAGLLRELPPTAELELERLGLIGAVRQVVQSELRSAFDQVDWQIQAEAEPIAQQLPQLGTEVIFFAAREALRNAARYGRGEQPGRSLHLTITLEVATNDTEIAEQRGLLRLLIADNGVGLGRAQQSLGGSGQGLALHTTMMAVIGGTLTAENNPHGGAVVTLALPVERW